MTGAFRNNLLLSGGVGHPFGATSAELSQIFWEYGVRTEIAAPPEWESALARIDEFDMLSVNALRWRMLAPRYDELRQEHAYHSAASLHDAIEVHVRAGRPIFALHTSCICFDDWPRWGEILGGSWDWDRSFHPAYATIGIARDERDAALLVNGLPTSNTNAEAYVRDEVYHGLAHTDSRSDPTATIALYGVVARTEVAQNEPPLGATGIGEPQPVIWRKTEGNARVLVDTLGHDQQSLRHRLHRKVLTEQLAWLFAAS